MTAPNVDLLRATLAHIEAHPDTWNQGTWRCETGMCFAGTAANLSGGRWLTPDPAHDHAHLLAAEPEEIPSGYLNGVPFVTAARRAQDLLGLRDGWAYRLFSTENDLDDLRHIVGEICDEAES